MIWSFLYLLNVNIYDNLNQYNILMLSSEDQNLISELKEAINKLSSKKLAENYNTYFRPAGLQSEILVLFEDLKDTLNKVAIDLFDKLDQNEMRTFLSRANWFLKIFQNIEKYNVAEPSWIFSPGTLQSNAKEAAAQIVREEINKHDVNARKTYFDANMLPLKEILKQLKLLKAYNFINNIDDQSLSKKLSSIEDADHRMVSLENKINLLNEASKKSSVDATNQIVGRVARVGYKIFNGYADKYKCSIGWWLFLTAFFSILVLIFIGLAYDLLKNHSEKYDYHLIVPYLSLTSFLAFLVFQSFKTYNANRHMQEINRHKANSIRFYDLLISTTDDIKAKELLIKDFAQAIYKESETGFITSRQNKNPIEYTSIFNQSTE
jgi:hypothetical protein